MQVVAILFVLAILASIVLGILEATNVTDLYSSSGTLCGHEYAPACD